MATDDFLEEFIDIYTEQTECSYLEALYVLATYSVNISPEVARYIRDCIDEYPIREWFTSCDEFELLDEIKEIVAKESYEEYDFDEVTIYKEDLLCNGRYIINEPELDYMEEYYEDEEWNPEE